MVERRGISAFVRRGKSSGCGARTSSLVTFGSRLKSLGCFSGYDFAVLPYFIHLFIHFISHYPTSTRGTVQQRLLLATELEPSSQILHS
jgi:hypothetical protein